jgi:hypothetical protein
MKMRSALNNEFLFFTLTSIIVGLVTIDQFDIVAYAPLLIFYVFFRIKIWLDDAIYFQQVKRKNYLFDFGIVLLIIGWFLYAIAGYLIKDINRSFAYLMWAIVVLTLWMVIDAIHQKEIYNSRRLSFILNLVYIGILFLITSPTIILTFDKKYLVYILVAGTIVDFIFTGSLKNFVE